MECFLACAGNLDDRALASQLLHRWTSGAAKDERRDAQLAGHENGHVTYTGVALDKKWSNYLSEMRPIHY